MRSDQLRLADVFARQDCGQARCELGEGAILVRSVPAPATGLTIRLRLAPRVRDARLASPRVGDILVTPATGAYGYAMANNYNGVPRPPVIFCSGGDARVVLRRETYADLRGRDA